MLVTLSLVSDVKIVSCNNKTTFKNVHLEFDEYELLDIINILFYFIFMKTLNSCTI